MAVTHTTTTAEPDDPTYDVSADAWNQAHTTADGSFVAAKLAASATDVLFGRSTAGAGNGQEIAATAAGRALLDDANAAAQLVTLGVGTDAAAGTGSMRTLGTGATQAAAGNHAHTIGAELAYTEFTGDVTISATVEASGTTVVTASGVAFDGSTIVLIEFYAQSVITAAATSAFVTIVLFEDGSPIGQLAVVLTALNTNPIRVPAHAARRMTPTNATHTYSIRAYRDGGAGTATVRGGAGGAGVAVPGFIRITRVN